MRLEGIDKAISPRQLVDEIEAATGTRPVIAYNPEEGWLESTVDVGDAAALVADHIPDHARNDVVERGAPEDASLFSDSLTDLGVVEQ